MARSQGYPVHSILVTDTPDRRVEILIALDGVVVTRSRYAAGQHGPDLHVHRLHADCCYVQAIGGTGEAFRTELAARFDQHPPPDDGGLDPSTVIVRKPGNAETVSAVAGQVEVAFLADASETLGAAGVLACTVAPGFPGSQLHVHDRTFDMFLMLDGRLLLQRGETPVELEQGDVVVVEPGTPHAFANPFDTPACFVDIHVPGGFEQSFRDAAAAMVEGPPDSAAMRAILERYDVRLA
jgi:mannose-6-phosphate isomerase-like protein (cupin superfamily)